MNPNAGGDTTERIQRHRASRAGKGFSTVEWWNYTSLPNITCGADKPVALVEDFGNLVANYLYPPCSDGLFSAQADADFCADELVRLIRKLSLLCADCICVSNEISLGGAVPAASRFYADVLAKLNMQWAALCDEVYFVTAGIPQEWCGQDAPFV